MIIRVTFILKHFTYIIDISTKAGTSHQALNTIFWEGENFFLHCRG